MRTKTTDTISKLGETLTVKGWVNSRRDHGGVIFIDLRDYNGLLQVVIQPENVDNFGEAEHLRDEYAIAVTGVLRERGEGLANPNLPTGQVELVADKFEVLNASQPLPISLNESNQSSEELRLKYRYLDLRRPKMQATLKQRAKYLSFIRRFMEDNDFLEVQTPILANSSPEGARDFLIPSRIHAGKFYALPQAPQQFKQLLMVGGIDKYYQIAPCFRDEDPRADRLYGDFYQLDLERAFVEDGEEIRSEMEVLIQNLVQDFAGKELVTTEIPRISYEDAMNIYGSDKPDLRFDMKLVDLDETLATTEFAVFKNAKKVKAICVKGAANLSRSQIDNFTEIAKKEGAGGLAYLTFVDGGIKSPIAKFLTETELAEITAKTGAEDGDIVFFGAGKPAVVNRVLGRMRNEFATFYNLKDKNKVALCWVVDFPFYEYDENNRKVDFGHNPFSLPKGGVKALEAAKTDADKLAIKADQFDMVMNGYEVCSGAVRNYNPEVMYKAFEILGYDNYFVAQKFGAMLEAFKFGAPPHAGCAFGLERIFMVLTGEDNIREVVAFPKSAAGVDLMMASPSDVDPKLLNELKLVLDIDFE
ncbi:aspartate--tRNA(Asp/Asn) ligase [Lactococcus hodotermopsidis]|uniref:Aspartate--tRNA(Asp/Asn) ligase n=1 Tax=Pseudolactococcus hodotermopsidis TaxID=2709157 RepID=A0A6A0BCA5_9LACT|nr:aspartate--tRNA ligase [Lactococcus hodotermopsidis]GFH42992.1 aspartate--tRNA(Asp/Asn) ligase [Lactococcus hodotermopsidis]